MIALSPSSIQRLPPSLPTVLLMAVFGEGRDKDKFKFWAGNRTKRLLKRQAIASADLAPAPEYFMAVGSAVARLPKWPETP